MSSIESIIENGTFYYPANKHYGFKGVVNCDMCQRTNIEASIGFGDDDLCMECISNLTKKPITTMPKTNNFAPLTRMASVDYAKPKTNNPTPLTRMASVDYNILSARERYISKTHMVSSDYKPSNEER